MKRSWLFGMAFIIGGCAMVHPMAPSVVLMIQPEIAPGRITQAQVYPYSKDSVDHLVIRLYAVNGEMEQDLGFSKTLTGGQVDSPVVFSNLSANTKVRIKAYAYSSVDNSQLISTEDENSYLDVVITNDDRPNMARLKVQLIDAPFNGGFISSVDLYPSYLSTGSGSLSIPIRGVVSSFAGGTATGFSDGLGEQARFQESHAVAADNEGNLYVADTLNYRIRKLSPRGLVTTLAGSGVSHYQDGSGTSASFKYPTGSALSVAKDLFVVDSQAHAIRKISQAGLVTTFAGAATAGKLDANGTNAKFDTPTGLAFDNTGNLYVTDTNNHLIRKIDPDGTVTTLAGSGAPGSADASGTLAAFNSPKGIVCDTQGNLYVADSGNHRVRKITSQGEVSTYAGSGAPGNLDGIGTAASFDSPSALGIDLQGNLYVADSNNHRVRKITPQGVVLSFVGGIEGYENGTGTAARFYCPIGLVVDPFNCLFVLDQSLPVIRKIE